MYIMYTMMVLAHLFNLWHVHRKYVHVWVHNMLYSKVHVYHMHESVLLFYNQKENCNYYHNTFKLRTIRIYFREHNSQIFQNVELQVV